MSDHARFWKEVHHQFDPDRPVAVDEPQLHVARKREYNALVTIERTLSARTRDYHRFLLTGAIGNGKSSELNAFSSRLVGSHLVVSFDLWAHLQGAIGDPKAINRILVWELLGLIGLALICGGEQRLGHKWKDEPKTLAARGETHHAASLGPSAAGGVPKTCSGPTTAAFSVLASDEKSGARRRAGFHHGLLEQARRVCGMMAPTIPSCASTSVRSPRA